MGEGDGDKSCDRNDSAKLLLARIRARNCPSLVVRLVRCRSRPRAAGRRGRGASSTQILRAHPHSPQEEAMSVTRTQPRTRPSGHWSIDFARGGLLRGDYASPSCRFPEEGRVHAGGGARGGRPGWGERGHDWRSRPGRGGQPRRPRYRPRGPRVRGLGSQPPRLVAIPLLSLDRDLHRIGNVDSPVDPDPVFPPAFCLRFLFER